MSYSIIIFGASGDLTKRLLVPAMYNLACDGLLNERFAVLGTATTDLDDAAFRERMSGDDGIRQFHTRKSFDVETWDALAKRFHYKPGRFDDLDHFKALKERVAQLDSEVGAGSAGADAMAEVGCAARRLGRGVVCHARTTPTPRRANLGYRYRGLTAL